MKFHLAGTCFFTLAMTICLCMTAPTIQAESWPFGSASGQTMGGAAMVISLQDTHLDGQPPRLDSLTLYPCPEIDCTTDRLDLKFAGHGIVKNKARLHYVAIDIPPGSYRLGQISGVVITENSSVRFKLPLAYTFQVREGKTAYLGRLLLTLRSKTTHKPFEYEAISASNATMAMGKKSTAMSYNYEIDDYYSYDSTALIRAYPNRRFLPMESSPMIWLQ